MKKIVVNAIIERTEDGTYTVFMDNYDYKFGLIGYGKTAKEAKNDFFVAYDEIKGMDVCEVPDFDFNFTYDTSSFLQLFKDKIGLANLQAITGINRRQLHHYVSGVSRPSKKTVQRIQEGIKKYGEELCKVQLI